MPEKIDRPGTAVKFVYRCSAPDCEFEALYRDVVKDHERDHKRGSPQPARSVLSDRHRRPV